MSSLFAVLILFSVIGLIVGLMKPSWLRLKSRKQSLLILGGSIILFFILFSVTNTENSQNLSNDTSQNFQHNITTSVEVISTTSPSTQKQTDPVTKISTQTSTKTEPVATKISGSTYGVRTKTSGCLGNTDLPDSACSPGAIFLVTASQVCVSGYSASVRNVTDSVRKAVFTEYGIPYSEHSNYEVDHLISLELGGNNDISNLWPEPYNITNGARMKDKLENYLHKQVCNGSMTLSRAQDEISHNWVSYYGQMSSTDQAVTSTADQDDTVETTQSSTTTISNQPSGLYYTSSYGGSKYYYPEACTDWKSLSSSYLKSFNSLSDLLAKYPSKTLSPQCN